MSKRTWQHPAPPADETTVSWRGLGQLQDTPEFREWLAREFPRGAAELEGEEEIETSRRSFLKLMGASTALAGFGLAACRRPEQYILPFAQAPEWLIPGKALYYASAMPRPQGATPRPGHVPGERGIAFCARPPYPGSNNFVGEARYGSEHFRFGFGF